MNTNYKTLYAIGPNEARAFDTKALRENFLAQGLFEDDKVNLVCTHYDRYIVGGVRPISIEVPLETIDPLKSAYFLERRELGVVNIGSTGTVSVDGERYTLNNKEALYIGKGAKTVTFESNSANEPATFYLNSAPAHHHYPNKKIGREDATVLEMGSLETSNERTIYQLIIEGVVETCQLQMGITCLKPGSVWNTLPAHQHDRRMEAYLYFDVPDNQAVCHIMGEPNETRLIWAGDQEAVISPPWSIHCGSGSASYAFVWGMAGENLDYSDMDKYPADALR
ncbi:5-dehydro-4-deoxy-D-glucuronate isomerase [Agaribacter marinus]|uniref:4-deoxy-L-threo-5-hexosulose-uronate ketol-isomerase n=1 Tax=Agaribacter marinus TaxID=1431249 RepID=A0AA37WM93_9ALTE|nr:5-dehydro-4-deoxy-D-glucuronate isomerase [Agaribacter marinus]GLR72605.1 4-deoxy-L-threo-5-hexosulose-uronate ketol-isomerase [Agaribacter marinus]